MKGTIRFAAGSVLILATLNLSEAAWAASTKNSELAALVAGSAEDDDRRRPAAATKLRIVSPPYPEAVRTVLDRGREDCLAEGGTALTYLPGTVRAADLTGDGRDDYVVDFRGSRCVERPTMFNGTGGWDLDILVANPSGGLSPVFSGRTWDYDVSKGRGARVMTFHLHGSFCGRAGADTCLKRRTITSEAFRFSER